VAIPLPIGQDIIFQVPFSLLLELAVILSLITVVDAAKLPPGCALGVDLACDDREALH
jgi:hypothetical protein